MNNRTEIAGTCLEIKKNAVLLGGWDEEFERWVPFRHIRLVAGHIGLGAYAEISVPRQFWESGDGEALQDAA